MTVDDKTLLANRFEEHRAHLRSVAWRMLGSPSEADDAVQEAWIRLGRTDTSDIANLGGWLTTVVARVCLDMLRSRTSRREDSLDGVIPPTIASTTTADPEQEAIMADSVGIALLVVLETLQPAERLAFVLHDMFAVPFDEIAPIVGRTPTATRQLASRARRRVQGKSTVLDVEQQEHKRIVTAFLDASREGDFAGLLAVLDPDIVFRSDAVAVARGSAAELRGAQAVAETFNGRAKAVRPALVDGAVGAVFAAGDELRLALEFTIEHGKIVAISASLDPERLAAIPFVELHD
jgi:RNA polymerase sigma-70 factor (ECF subfamily)